MTRSGNVSNKRLLIGIAFLSSRMHVHCHLHSVFSKVLSTCLCLAARRVSPIMLQPRYRRASRVGGQRKGGQTGCQAGHIDSEHYPLFPGLSRPPCQSRLTAVTNLPHCPAYISAARRLDVYIFFSWISVNRSIGAGELRTHFRIWFTGLHYSLNMTSWLFGHPAGRWWRERRITHGHFYRPGLEVAHITSAHIPLALFSRELEK